VSVLARASPETLRAVRAIRRDLAEHADRRGDRLEVRYNTGWIAFRSAAANRAFAEVRPSKKGIEIFLLPPRASLRDPDGLAVPVPPSRGWGWFRTRAKVDDGLSPSVAAALLRQSYEYARRMPRPRRSRRKP
jgi:predicted transport protein